ncbi:MAG: YbbR-like domain-containing protein [bacterium]|nr:YbbR-like domain-containing protein [bacterium]
MKSLLNNLWLKLLALLIGLLVWFHVVTEKSYTYEVMLPVTDVDLRDDLTIATQPPDSILVIVSAKGKQLVQSSWRERGLRINISKLPTGHHTLYLTPENIQLYAPFKNVVLEEVISPVQWEIEIDPKVTVELPVSPTIIASPDEGFAVSSRVQATPAKAKLTGPRSIIKTLSFLLTEPKELNGLRNSITVPAALAVPAGMSMKVEPETVMVRIDVVPVKTRVYDNLPVAVYHLPPDYLAKTNPPSVRVELTGPPEDIELLNKNALTVAADYRHMTKEGMAVISVDCPANFRVKAVSVDSVRILATPHARSRN